MLWYLYCAIPDREEPDLSGFGGEGAPLEVIHAGGVAGVAGKVPASRYGSRALALATKDAQSVAPYAVAHQAVVQHVFERVSVVVPMSFGSVYRTRAEAEAALAERGASLRRLFGRLRGMQEWGLRVVWHAPEAPKVSPETPGAGTAFLQGRREELRSRAPDDAARKLAERLAGKLKKASERERVTETARGDLLLRASYLVAAGRAQRLREAVLSANDDLVKHGLLAELSGPWPPYTFAQ